MALFHFSPEVEANVKNANVTAHIKPHINLDDVSGKLNSTHTIDIGPRAAKAARMLGKGAALLGGGIAAGGVAYAGTHAVRSHINRKKDKAAKIANEAK